MGLDFTMFVVFFRKIDHHLTPLKITKSTQGAGKMILRHALRYPEIMADCEAYTLSIRPNYFWKTTPKCPACRPFLIFAKKCFGQNHGYRKADLAQTAGVFFGPALPVIWPGHFKSFTYREAKILKPYIYIYIYMAVSGENRLEKQIITNCKLPE